MTRLLPPRRLTLAAALWRSGVSEARILAGLVDDLFELDALSKLAGQVFAGVGVDHEPGALGDLPGQLAHPRVCAQQRNRHPIADGLRSSQQPEHFVTQARRRPGPQPKLRQDMLNGARWLKAHQLSTKKLAPLDGSLYEVRVVKSGQVASLSVNV